VTLREQEVARMTIGNVDDVAAQAEA